jgi:ubiquinone/menaquinone biosynthesis C-methylase UbiE
MMNEDSLINSWKNSEVFKKQLDFNLNELESPDTYPEHWKLSLAILEQVKPSSILDVGCGCGSFYKVCKDNIPTVNYFGCDYSEDAISLAKETWNSDNFFVRDATELNEDDAKKYDLLYASALMDVSPDGDSMLKHILSLGFDRILFSRVKMTNEESYYETYNAYDEIETCAYYHNVENLIKLFEEHEYGYQNFSDHIFLSRLT